MKFIHCADIHLDSPLRGLDRYEGAPVEELRGATRKALENLVRLAVDERVEFVLIAGDIYDGDWRDYNTGLFFARQMSTLREAGIRVCIVQGNHDAASQITRELRLPDNVCSFSSRKCETVELDDIGVAIHGRSFHKRAVTEDLAASFPLAQGAVFNIGILHTSLNGREGHEKYAPCSLHELKSKGYHYWALGHVHKCEIVSQEPWVVFPGNIQGRHIRETGMKGCALVTVTDDEVESVEQRPLDVARWREVLVDVTNAPDMDEVLGHVRHALLIVKESGEDSLIAMRIHIAGHCLAHKALAKKREQLINEVRMLANDIGNGRFWIEKVKLQTRSAINIDELAIGNDPLGQLIQYIRAISGSDSLCRELLAEFKDIKQKLPIELRQADALNGEESFNFDEPSFVLSLLEDVEQLLIPLLVEEEDEV